MSGMAKPVTKCPWCDRPFGDTLAAAAHERAVHGKRVAKGIAAAETELHVVRLFGTPSQLEALTIRVAVEAGAKGTACTVQVEPSRRVGDDPYTVVLKAPNRNQAWDTVERAGTHLTDRRVRMAFKRTARLAIERTIPLARPRTR